MSQSDLSDGALKIVHSIITKNVMLGMHEEDNEKITPAAHEFKRNLEAYAKLCDSEVIILILGKIDKDFLSSSQPSLRRNGLVMVRTMMNALKYILGDSVSQFVDILTASASDQDPTVRAAVCDAILLLEETPQKMLLKYINKLFIALSLLVSDIDHKVKNMGDFLSNHFLDLIIINDCQSVDLVFPLIYQFLFSSNISGKLYIISWIKLLRDVRPEKSLEYFPEWFDGILNIYCEDNNLLQNEVKRLLDAYLDSISVYTDKIDISKIFDILLAHSISTKLHIKMVVFHWILTIVKVFGVHVTSFYPVIYGIIYKYFKAQSSCVLSEKCESINMAIKNTTLELAEIRKNENWNIFDLKLFSEILKKSLSTDDLNTLLISIGWCKILLSKFPKKFSSHISILFDTLLGLIRNDSNEVSEIAISFIVDVVNLSMSGDEFEGDKIDYLYLFVEGIVQWLVSEDFSKINDHELFIMKAICIYLDPIIFYRQMSQIIVQTMDKSVIGVLVHYLNVMLLTLDQTSKIRAYLIQDDQNDSNKLFYDLFKCWVYNPISVLSLCLLCGQYFIAYEIVQNFQFLEFSLENLMELDHLVQLIESPLFTFMRLKLLDVEVGIYIRTVLCGILMILPQSEAFHVLRKRLQVVSCLDSINLKNAKPQKVAREIVAQIAFFKSVHNIS